MEEAAGEKHRAVCVNTDAFSLERDGPRRLEDWLPVQMNISDKSQGPLSFSLPSDTFLLVTPLSVLSDCCTVMNHPR